MSELDGSDLLQLSTQFNVHVSLVQNPLALKVEGVRETLNGVRDHIQNIKKVHTLFAARCKHITWSTA